jgi:hypothetical protein
MTLQATADRISGKTEQEPSRAWHGAETERGTYLLAPDIRWNGREQDLEPRRRPRLRDINATKDPHWWVDSGASPGG